MRAYRHLIGIALLATLLVACSNPGGGSGRGPLEVNGIWGGVFTHGGTDFAVFAMEVTTSVSGSTGTISGYGLMTDGYTDVLLSVSGSTGRDTVEVVLTDVVNDRLYLSGQPDGRVVRGNWTFPSAAVAGTFRMSYEDNIHLLSSASAMSAGSAPGTFEDFDFPGRWQ